MNMLQSNMYNLREIAGRLTEHDRKVRFIETIAVLSGCRETLHWLPDGLCPDVVRLDTNRGILFIGDAKHTETPGGKDTQTRLLRYLNWFAAHTGVGIFVICCERLTDAREWLDVIHLLSHEAGIHFRGCGIEQFGPGLNVIWFISGCNYYNRRRRHVSTH